MISLFYIIVYRWLEIKEKYLFTN